MADTAPRYQQVQTRTRTADGSAYPELDVANGDTNLVGAQIAVKVQSQSISGRVIDTAGAPIADALVKALAMPTKGSPKFDSWLKLPLTFTDADRSFTLAGLADGNYGLTARSVDGGEGTAINVAGSTSATVQVERPGAIDGTLTGFPVTPVVYASDVAQITNSPMADRVDAGSFHLSGLRPGRYVVSEYRARWRCTDHRSARGSNRSRRAHGSRACIDRRIGLRLQDTATDRRRRVSRHQLRRRYRRPDELERTRYSEDGRERPRGTRSGTRRPWATAVRDAIRRDVAPICGRLAPSRLARKRAGVFRDVLRRVSGNDRCGVRLAKHPRFASVDPNGPAASAGILVGDVVTSVDGASVVGLNGAGVAALIANNVGGASIQLVISRAQVILRITVTGQPRTFQ